MAKTIEQLKSEQKVAKQSFTRLRNNIIRTHDSMSEEQLRDSFSKITILAKKVMETNEEVTAGVIEEEETKLDEGESVKLTEQQKADIARTEKEYDEKLKEVGELLGRTLWTKFGDELSTAVELAEAEVERVGRVRTDGNLDAYEFRLTHLKMLVESAKKAHCKWQQWVPVEGQREYRSRLKELEHQSTRLVSRKAEFIMARQPEKCCQ